MNIAQAIEDLGQDSVSFANDVLRKPPIYNPNLEYMFHLVDSYYSDVNLNFVAGTKHPSYRNKTWWELRPQPGTFKNKDNFEWIDSSNNLMKRMKQNTGSFNDNYCNLFDDSIKQEWSFWLFPGNKYFISSGNHRTVFARFASKVLNCDPVIKNVKVHKYDIVLKHF